LRKIEKQLGNNVERIKSTMRGKKLHQLVKWGQAMNTDWFLQGIIDIDFISIIAATNLIEILQHAH